MQIRETKMDLMNREGIGERREMTCNVWHIALPCFKQIINYIIASDLHGTDCYLGEDWL